MSDFKGVITYIAGPVTGIADCNRPLFDQVERELKDLGAIVLKPTVLPDGLRSHQSYMNICIPMLRESSAVVFLPGWERSTGACMEHFDASLLGLPLYEYRPGEAVPITTMGESANV